MYLLVAKGTPLVAKGIYRYIVADLEFLKEGFQVRSAWNFWATPTFTCNTPIFLYKGVLGQAATLTFEI